LERAISRESQERRRVGRILYPGGLPFRVMDRDPRTGVRPHSIGRVPQSPAEDKEHVGAELTASGEEVADPRSV
jgi:hypothetical protein